MGDEGILLKYSNKNKRKLLKTILLWQLHKFFSEPILRDSKNKQQNLSLESHVMDSKIIQLIIKGILDTEEYTLEGIAYYTNTPFDIIYNAACGIDNQVSITFWARVVDLYLKVKPDVSYVLINKLIESAEKNRSEFSSLLAER